MRRGLRRFTPVLEDSYFINNNIEEIKIMELNNLMAKTKIGTCEYVMSAEMASMLLKDKPKKLRPQEWLCYIVDNEFDLKGKCIKVTIQ